MKEKLGSRKLWAGIVSFITAILLAFNVDAVTIEQVVLIVSGIGALVVYIIAEAHIDGKREDSLIIDFNDKEEGKDD